MYTHIHATISKFESKNYEFITSSEIGHLTAQSSDESKITTSIKYLL